MSSSFLPWLALGVAGYFVIDRVSRTSVEDEAKAGVPVPLQPGIRYLFLVRLESTEASARPVLESKGVEQLKFTTDSMVPPFWTKPGEPFSTAVASFIAEPKGSSTIELGTPFYGVGRLEKLIRLDGQPFSTPVGTV